MAPGGSPKDGGTMADNSRMVHRSDENEKFRTLKNRIR